MGRTMRPSSSPAIECCLSTALPPPPSRGQVRISRKEPELTGNELIVDYLTSVPAWYLATVEDTLEGAQPHVRPFSFAALQDGEIQFCTATTKDCYREMQANPRVELTAWKPGRGWVILRGRANLEDRANATVREEGFKHMVALGEGWDDPADPRLTFFTIDDAEAWLCDIDGSWNPIEL